jgi:hypothetical protein
MDHRTPDFSDSTFGSIAHYPWRQQLVTSINLDGQHIHHWVGACLDKHLADWEALDGLYESNYKLMRQNELLAYVARDLSDTFVWTAASGTLPSQIVLQV